MSFDHIILFNIALLVAIASPGPAMLVAIQTSISEGKVAGIAIGCGLGAMASVWTLLALLGLDSLFKLFPLAYIIAKIAGAIYLIYIAWNTWRGASRSLKEQSKPAAHAFRNGILINLSNPKSVLFAAAVLIVIFPPGITLLEKGLIAANHFLVEILFYAILAFVMNTTSARRVYLSAKLFLDRCAAIVIGALALRILYQSTKD